MATETTLQRLAGLLLGEPVVPWLLARRPGTTWRQIAAELRLATNGEIDLPPQTLIKWCEGQAADPTDEGVRATG